MVLRYTALCLLGSLIVGCSSSTTYEGEGGGKAGGAGESGAGGEDTGAGGKSHRGGAEQAGDAGESPVAGRSGAAGAEDGGLAGEVETGKGGKTGTGGRGGSGGRGGAPPAEGGSAGEAGAVGRGGVIVAGASGAESEGGTAGEAGSPGTGGVAGEVAIVGGAPNNGGSAGETPGAGGAIPLEPVQIVTSELPPGRFNMDYSVGLEASGRPANELTWAVSSGSLPEGVELSPNGILSGRPASTGTFNVQISVSANDGATTNAVFVIRVDRHSFIAYTGNLGTKVSERHLYLTKGPNLQRFQLSNSFADDPDYPDERRYAGCPLFSPDGRRLVFTADQQRAGFYSLFSVDLSSGEIAVTRKISNPESNTNGVNWAEAADRKQNFLGIAWSPSGELFAYQAEDNASGESQIYLVDFRADDPAPVKVGTIDVLNLADLVFVSETQLLVAINNDVLYRVDWSSGAPGQVTQVPIAFSPFYPDLRLSPDGSRILLMDSINPSSGPRIEVLANGGEDYWTNADSRWGMAITEDLTRISAGSFIYDLTSLTNPVTLFDTGAGQGVMTKQGNWLGWVSDNTVHLTDLRSVSPTTIDVSTESDYVGNLAFSEKEAWMAFVPGGRQVKVYPIQGGVLPTTVSSEFADPSGSVTYLGFSPNGDSLAYAAPMSRAGYSDLYLVDLKGGSPSSWRLLTAGLGETHGVHQSSLRFSSDSSRAVFLSGSNERDEVHLHFVNLLDAEPEAEGISTQSCLGTPDNCRQISEVALQP